MFWAQQNLGAPLKFLGALPPNAPPVATGLFRKHNILPETRTNLEVNAYCLGIKQMWNFGYYHALK